MPTVRPARPCPGRGPRRSSCPNLIHGNEKECQDCEPYVKKARKAYDTRRDQTPGRQFLHSAKWRRARSAKLSQDPLCNRCSMNGLVVPAVLVHHINQDELDTSPGNLESLCNPCHESIHGAGRWGVTKRKDIKL